MARLPEKPLKLRILENVVINDRGCWVWTKGKTGGARGGYGAIRLGRRSEGTYKIRGVHVVAYEVWRGAVPAGLQIDHVVCQNKLCCNPWHLEAVTSRINTIRNNGVAAKNASKRSCKHGHKFTPANTYINPRGNRECRTCRSAAVKRCVAA